MSSCKCPCPPLCKLLGRHVSGRLWEIWSEQFTSDPLPSRRCHLYREMWCRESGVDLQRALDVGCSRITPSIVQRAKSFVSASVKHALQGFPKASPDELSRRMRLCRACPHQTDDGRCSLCGCKTRLKASWAEQRCPIGRWSDPVLTIGMACYDDFYGVYQTALGLIVYHRDLLEECEIVVVDNNPSSRHGQATRKWCSGRPGIRYVPFTDRTGTAAPRDEVFHQARGEFVLCIDSHVLLEPGALENLLDYYRQNPETKDLLQGPCVAEDGRLHGTHQRPQWGGGSWGIWSHDPRGEDPSGKPFEVWQQGMGLFSCRKDAWPGFHPDMSGFGGCETYIAESFRINGGKVLCCPWLRWYHRFLNPDGYKDPRTEDDKRRNYEIGFMGLGLPVPPEVRSPYSDGYRPKRSWTLKRFTSLGVARPSLGADPIAFAGDPKYGPVKMRGKPLAAKYSGRVELPNRIRGRSAVLVAFKCHSRDLRRRCDRFVLDPCDLFWHEHDKWTPERYWRQIWESSLFDDVVATSPACQSLMRSCLPECVHVHLVPHHCDPGLSPSYDPLGHVAYAGQTCFIESRLSQIRRACDMIGKEFRHSVDPRVLRGACLGLALRCPPYDTPLNRICKPQIKLENIAAAGLPCVSTDDEAAVSLRPEVVTVGSTFTPSELAEAMMRAIEQGPLSRPYTKEMFLRDFTSALGTA